MGKGRGIRGNLAGKDCPAQDVRRLDRHEMRSRKRTGGKQLQRPRPVLAAIGEGRDNQRRVGNEHQR